MIFQPNYRTKLRQITEWNIAKLPNKTQPNYQIKKNLYICNQKNKLFMTKVELYRPRIADRILERKLI